MPASAAKFMLSNVVNEETHLRSCSYVMLETHCETKSRREKEEMSSKQGQHLPLSRSLGRAVAGLQEQDQMRGPTETLSEEMEFTWWPVEPPVKILAF